MQQTDLSAGVSTCPDHFFFYFFIFLPLLSYNQLHPGHRRHAAHDAGAGLHVHRVHEHQEPGAGEGAAAQRGAACRRHPELGPVGLKVHREHCSARGSLCAHKCHGQG